MKILYRISDFNTNILSLFSKSSFPALQNKNWKDLLTDEPFARKDIIVLQDPQNLDKFNISKFQHLKKDWKVAEEDKVHAKYYLKNANAETEDILAELSKTYKGLLATFIILYGSLCNECKSAAAVFCHDYDTKSSESSH